MKLFTAVSLLSLLFSRVDAKELYWVSFVVIGGMVHFVAQLPPLQLQLQMPILLNELPPRAEATDGVSPTMALVRCMSKLTPVASPSHATFSPSDDTL